MDERISFVRRVIPATETQFSVDWTPASLGSALILWLKADTGITLSSSNVITWADQSGNNNHVTVSSTGTMPAYDATGFNSKPTVVFSNPSGLTTAINSVTGLSSLSSWFWAGTFDVSQGSVNRLASFLQTIVTGLETDNSAGSIVGLTCGFSNNYFVQGPAAQHFSVIYGPPATQSVFSSVNYRIGHVFDSTNFTIYVNNLQVHQEPLSFTLTSPGTIRVGAYLQANSTSTVNGSTSNCWSGPVSELIVTNTALSGSDRNNLDNYLKSHWNL